MAKKHYFKVLALILLFLSLVHPSITEILPATPIWKNCVSN